MRTVVALAILLASVASGCGGPCGTDAAGIGRVPGAYDQLAVGPLNATLAIAVGVDVNMPPGLDGLDVDGTPLPAGSYSLRAVAYEAGPYRAGSRSGQQGFWLDLRADTWHSGGNGTYFWGTFDQDEPGAEVREHARRFWDGVLADPADVDAAVAAVLAHERDDDGLVIHQFDVPWELDLQGLHDDLDAAGGVELDVRHDADVDAIEGLSEDDVEETAFVSGPWVFRVEVDTKELVQTGGGDAIQYVVNVMDVVFVRDFKLGARGMSDAQAAAALEVGMAERGLPAPALDRDEVAAFGWCS